MANELVALLREKKRLWQEIYNLTLAQGELLTPDRAGELLQVLERREECIAALKVLEDKISDREAELPVAGRAMKTGHIAGKVQENRQGRDESAIPVVPAGDGSAGGEEPETVDLLLGKITALMEKVKEADEENRRRIRENFTRFKKELEDFRKVKKAVLVYHRGGGSGFFIDKNL
ncbi:flagellar export chaperone FlgN [Neomoorella mulderi]|uniref:FlgN protein n=1 Tax=Moorella mulderi DSM 14980 TaxID=1122241 RepID=A0A151AZ40_9FIRM|nr:flagellar export chaperone FlgN [Moorella mulderi]KYH32677.1 FlgN protein [Moorella mulderi DSM 14980]